MGTVSEGLVWHEVVFKSRVSGSVFPVDFGERRVVQGGVGCIEEGLVYAFCD